MLSTCIPKLPMRQKMATIRYYEALGFEAMHDVYAEYLMMQHGQIEIHFFLYEQLDPGTNYGQVYIRVTNIQEWYSELLQKAISIHPNGKLEAKPWGQWEFSLLDPDKNLLTFGESVGTL